MPLPQPYPELAALDLLVSVGELGSISAAARAHHVTQPAASMRLRSLEQTLQVRLLDRAKSGTRLTPEGEAMVEWAASVLREMRTLLAGTAALRADLDSHLRLAASLTVAEYLLPRWFELLAAAHPEVKLSLEMGNTSHVAELASSGQVDLGFIEGPSAPAGLRSKQVSGDELVVVVGRGHRWRHRDLPLTPAELAATPLVLREPGSGTREVLAQALAEHGLAPTAAMELGSTTAIKSAVITGAGPAVVSVLAVSAELASGQLTAIPFEGLGLQRAIRAVWAPDRALPAQARHLIEIASSRRLA